MTNYAEKCSHSTKSMDGSHPEPVIRCEICGQRYCPMCAVDPEFYQGNDCPWCADMSDMAARAHGEVRLTIPLDGK